MSSLSSRNIYTGAEVSRWLAELCRRYDVVLWKKDLKKYKAKTTKSLLHRMFHVLIHGHGLSLESIPPKLSIVGLTKKYPDFSKELRKAKI